MKIAGVSPARLCQVVIRPTRHGQGTRRGLFGRPVDPDRPQPRGATGRPVDPRLRSGGPHTRPLFLGHGRFSKSKRLDPAFSRFHPLILVRYPGTDTDIVSAICKSHKASKHAITGTEFSAPHVMICQRPYPITRRKRKRPGGRRVQRFAHHGRESPALTSFARVAVWFWHFRARMLSILNRKPKPARGTHVIHEGVPHRRTRAAIGRVFAW